MITITLSKFTSITISIMITASRLRLLIMITFYLMYVAHKLLHILRI